jgi:hypothetical protein
MHAMKDAKKVYKKNKTMKAGRAGKSRKNRAAKEGGGRGRWSGATVGQCH